MHQPVVISLMTPGHIQPTILNRISYHKQMNHEMVPLRQRWVLFLLVSWVWLDLRKESKMINKNQLVKKNK